MANIAAERPNAVLVFADGEWRELSPAGEGRWTAPGVECALRPAGNGVRLELSAPDKAVRQIRIRWNAKARPNVRILNDHWERGYGDLEWRGIVPERVLPWYFLAYDGKVTSGLGVKTGPRAFCWWHVDADGVTLAADVSNGAEGVRLGARTLQAAVIVSDDGREGESPFEAARRFCSMLCDAPVMPRGPVYGGNNWYYAYGNSSQEEILEDSRFMSSLSDHPEHRPYMVIDDGWQLVSGGGACNGGPWVGNGKFPDMEGLAGRMKELGVIPGLWCRPLLTADSVPQEWIRYDASGGHVLDPSVPEVLKLVEEDVRRMVGWGYRMLKHDFTSYDITGQWGIWMKTRPHQLPHAFRDRSRTTAEIVLDLYDTIAEAAGDAEIIGCNTFGHLAAGRFSIQRTGDDTSGKLWERTRYMGVNTLAFRMPQHGTFYSHDADCAGITDRVPWDLNRQWLRLLAGSGTPLFVSASPSGVTEEQKRELRAAFELAAREPSPAEPLDWLDTTCPARWKLNGEEVRFEWNKASAELLSGGEDNAWWL